MQQEIKKLISVCSWFVALQVVTLIAFLAGAGFIYADLQKLKQTMTAGSPGGGSTRDIENWREYVRDHNAARGDAKAKVVLVEFTDFQCPYCKTFSEGTSKQLIEKYGDKIRVVFKHYPLVQIHPEAKQAAVAAQCALREAKFWEINDVFFGNQKQLSTADLIAAGKALGLGSRYEACVTNQETLAEVEQDIQDATKVGVQGTPSFIVNGKYISGAIPMADLESIIKKL